MPKPRGSADRPDSSSGTFRFSHELYKRGDKDAPDVIKDNNGDIALSMCRRCGRAESELDEPCTPKGELVNSLAQRIAGMKQRHDNANPLWAGPSGGGDLGGITQSMISRFLSCRERFRLKYLLGLELPDRWNHKIGYGNMWHVCEEALAGCKDKDGGLNVLLGQYGVLAGHTKQMLQRYPMQREEITKWWNVCQVQFPEYVHYWQDHPDVLNRTPLLQEEIFDVPYRLPSGRTVRLRGKWDSVDLIKDEVTGPEGGIYLQENKTKGDVDKERVERQMKFDLQTLVYLVALVNYQKIEGNGISSLKWSDGNTPILGVRYNVIRRPFGGGRGNISPHKERATKTKFTPKESDEHFYERLRTDYIAAEPDYWFFRVRTEVSAEDIKVFRETCLDPILEQVCEWYEQLTGRYESFIVTKGHRLPMNWRTPFGVWSALEEDRSTEYDAYLATGSEAGLRRVESLFPELQS